MKAKCEFCGGEVWMADMPIPPDKEARNDSNEIMILCEACRLKRKKSFRFIGVEAIESNPRVSGNGAVVYVPRKWMGCHVVVVRLDEGSETTEPR